MADELEEIAFLLPEEITGYKTKDYASEVSLPGYEWEKGEYDETADNCCP